MNKKGIGEQTLKYMIILAIVTLILFAFTKSLQTGLNNATRGTGCYNSMTINSFTKVEYGIGTYDGIDLFCPKYDLIFKKKIAELFVTSRDASGEVKTKKHKTIEYKTNDNKLNKDLINDLVAREMVECWKQFGAGKMPAFWVPEPIWKKVFHDVPTDSVGCRICSEIKFENGVWNSEVFGLKDYMKQTTLSKSVTSTTSGFIYDYIANRESGCGEVQGGENCWETFAKLPLVRINTNKPIKPSEQNLIVFTRMNTNKYEGTLNVYHMTLDEYKYTCKYNLPYI